uniref:Uncharacterized protein n=1 Tax=viral metagenome TaxID=1070528 RepID=A0A6C0BZZ9_9ZZZZ
MPLDINTLINALDNDDNAKLMKLDYSTVNKMKNDMLQRLGLRREVLVKYHKSLKHYRYIDEIPDIKFGSYVRWIPLSNPDNIKLTNGGVVCDVKIGDDVSVLCRNRKNLVFEFKMAKCLVFQKLSEEERVLLSAMEYLNK